MDDEVASRMHEVSAQTIVALLTIIGSFTVIIVSLVTGHPIPGDIMTLITVQLAAVMGWYFGVRGTATGAATVRAAHADTVAAVAAANTISHDQAVRMMEAAGHEAPPPAAPEP